MIEIITGRERRRRWSVVEKLRIVAESHESGARVCDVAARHDVSPSLLSTAVRIRVYPAISRFRSTAGHAGRKRHLGDWMERRVALTA